MTEQSFKDKVVKGTIWSGIDNVASYFVTFIVGIVLARLLTPDDYGLVGLTGVLTAILGCFVNAGFDRALIRKKDATEEDYSTVFLVNLGTSFFLYMVIFACASFVADFFGRQQLVNLTRVASFGMILSALSIVQRTRLTKQLNFKSQTKITIYVSIVRGIIGISSALLGCGVWALVIQTLVGNALTTILLFWVDRWHPSFRFSMKSFVELFGFGSKLMVSTLIDTIWNQCYQIVIGKCYAPATLGQYARANSFSDIFSSNLTSIVQRVSYPVLSEIQDNHQQLRDAYRRIIKTTMLVTFCCMLMLAAIAHPMVMVLIGEKWLQSVEFLQIICFSSMLYPLHAINLNMLQVQGRSDLFLKLEIIKKIFAIGPIVLGIFVGIYWMLIGGVLIGFISYYLNAYYSGPFLKYSMSQQIKDVLPSFCIAFVGALFAYIVSVVAYTFFSDLNWTVNLAILFLQLLMGISIIIILCEKNKIKEYFELKGIIIHAYQRFK